MPETIDAGVIETTSDERTMAVLSHALQLVGGWIAPLIIFLVKRDSRFVSFHALQALLLQGVHLVFMMLFMVVWFTLIFSQIFLHMHGERWNPSPLFFILFPLVWMGFMGFWLFTLIIVIVYSIKAGHGEWAEYPVLGRLARRFLKLGPGGIPLTAR